ncbi:helix-turn-helix domain-containing protein [Leptospira sp. WS39.C2]
MGKSIQSLQLAHRFIEDHYSEELDLKKIAKLSAISPFHFHRLFKSNFKIGCIDFLRQIRLENSLRLLAYTNQSISDIGYEVGFQNTETFIRNFKQKYSITPSNYRKNTNLLKPKMFLEKEDNRVKKVKNPFTQIKTLTNFNLCILRHNGKPSSLSKTLRKLMDLTIGLGFLNQKIEFFVRTLDPPNLEETELERIDIGVLLPISYSTPLGYPLEKIKFKSGRYLSLIHKESISSIESSYKKAYDYFLENEKILLANESPWEIYRKIPPFHSQTEVEILFRLKE